MKKNQTIHKPQAKKQEGSCLLAFNPFLEATSEIQRVHTEPLKLFCISWLPYLKSVPGGWGAAGQNCNVCGPILQARAPNTTVVTQHLPIQALKTQGSCVPSGTP